LIARWFCTPFKAAGSIIFSDYMAGSFFRMPQSGAEQVKGAVELKNLVLDGKRVNVCVSLPSGVVTGQADHHRM
jgi:hypothetical protein